MVESKQGYIFEIQRMSTEDGPGIRTTVFFKECPLRCVWCHNPESLEKKPAILWYGVKCIGCESCVEVCLEKAITLDQSGVHIDRKKCKACGKCVDVCPTTALIKMGDTWNLEELMKEVSKDRAYYTKSKGGITASGGAAAMQTEFLTEFLKRCKEEGFHTALDICGILPKNKYIPLIPFTDLYLYDLKEIDPIKHKQFTGLKNDIILENLIWLQDEISKNDIDAKIWIRTPVIPGYTATDENIKGIGEFITKQLNNKIERWDLLSFNNLAKEKYEKMDLDWPLKDTELMTRQEMVHFYEIAVKTGIKNVQWSGLTRNESIIETNKNLSKEIGTQKFC